jgi:hypothetical protein
VLGTVALVACSGTDTSPAVPVDSGAAPRGNLLAIDRFVSPEPTQDPEAVHRESGCATGTPRVEDGTLELETGDCVFHWTGIPLLDALAAGEAITLVTTHSALAARTPGEAHLRIDLDDETLVDRRIPIPSADAIDIATVTIKEPHGTGARLRVHLHNHGANNWRVVSLTRR